MSKNGLYSNLFNTQVKRENNEINGDSLESDEDIIDDKNINTEYATPSSQSKNRQISLKVSIYY